MFLKSTWFKVIVAVIFIWGITLRSVEVLNHNFLFGFDNGRDFMIARDMVENHKLRLIGAEAGSGSAALKGLFHGPGYYYLLALSYVVFQKNPYGALIIMFLFGITTMVLTYKLTYKIFGRYAAMAALFMVSVSDLVVSQSRFIWGPHPIFPFIILSLFFLYRAYVKPQLGIPLALLFASWTYHFHIGVAVPMVLSILISEIFIYRIKSLKIYLLSMFAVILGFLPMLLFELRHNFLALSNLFNYFTDSTYAKIPINWVFFKEHLFSYWYNFVNTYLFPFSAIPIMVQTILILVVLGLVFWIIRSEKDHANQRFFRSTTLMVAVSFIFYLQLRDTIWDFYLLHNRLIYILLFAYAIGLYIRKLQQGRLIFSIKAILFLFFISMAIGSIQRMNASFRYDYAEKPIFQKIKGKIAIIDYIYNDAKGNNFNIIVSVPYLHPYPYQYLLETYARSRFGFVPADHKNGLVYMIVEPDRDQPWMRSDWILKQSAGSELISEREILPDLIIQKRIYEE
ncbi:hypothetical protein A2154_01510 [Candidatus Gottesmanbacteria bacterium RBG_16_43_7]|uniref:Glycosyltransferase RgtA/B/C/D-like domain-containing protein n=1 Tax=Candidatus Gottesmanbacteria bacterium RBG_16_43_7 TaxID=1798373 RepID=A0A1F5Z841_9BACT|nr:MAG: hypothetical protein A2154_01510 [Candidatus Gottesmanbacteria bacterium RBG_16_43_7]